MNARIITALVVTIVLTALLILGSQHYLGLRAKAALADSRGDKLETTSGMQGDAAHADKDAAQVDTDVKQGREGFKITIEEAKRNEPETSARADRVVPDSVRGAYHARRLARERSRQPDDER